MGQQWVWELSSRSKERNLKVWERVLSKSLDCETRRERRTVVLLS